MRPKEGNPMADIKLTRPAAGQNVVVPSAPDARMVLDFAADQVSIDRPQGSDSLFFRFDDGSSIELQNFYTQYNKEAIPSFEVDGQLIAGADFFNAFGPDLAPAAGPAAGPTRAGGYTDYTNSDLADGLNSLGGLDLQLDGGAAGDGALLAAATATAVTGAAAAPDTTPPQVSITLAMTTANGDKVLNIAEAASERSVTLSGIVTVSADTASIPSTVELMLGNISLGNATLTLNADGTYSYTLEVAGAMFKDSPVQQVTTSITVADAAGNTATAQAQDTFTQDTDAPTANITINVIAGDDVMNKAESEQSDTSISGTVTGDVKVGDTVTLTVNGHEYTTAVVDLGNGVLGYQTSVSSADLLNDHNIDAKVVTYDEAGNPGVGTATREIGVDITPPEAAITIGVIAGDDVLNIVESAKETTLVGGQVSGDVKVGDTVTLTVNGHTYTTSVVSTNGVLGYQTQVATSDLSADHSIDAKVVTTDPAGNSTEATASRTIDVDTTPPTAGITVGVVAGDDVLNIVESMHLRTLVGGTVSGDVKAGDTVTLTINGHTYTTTVVNNNGVLGYETNVRTFDLWADRSIDAKVVTYDPAGNPTEATASRTVNFDLTPPAAAITIGVIAGDDVINIAENAQAKTLVGGTVGGDVKVGDTITLLINGHEYTTTAVSTNGVLGYQVEVNTYDLRGDHEVDALVVTRDAAGNLGFATASRTVSFDTRAPHADITIGVIAGDDVINIVENAQTTTTVGGTVGADVKLGDTVTLTVNGHTYTTSVINIGGNKLGYSTQVDTADLRADHSIEAKVVTYDAAGNPGSDTATRTVNFDTTPPTAAITIGVIAGDDVLNISENAQTKTTVGGTVGADVKLGDTVTLTVNGHTYNTTVVNIGGNKLGYSTQVNTADLRADQSIDAKVVTYDAAGNPASATASRDVSFDTTPPTAAITIGVIAGDDVINIAENNQSKTTVGGTVGGDVKAGDTVTLTVNGHAYTATVVNTGGTLGYSTQVNTSDLRADHSIDAKVVTYDAAGNPGSATATRAVSFDTRAPHADITIGVIAGDDVINIAESNQPTTTVGGTVGEDVKLGDTVTLTVNGHTYTTSVVNIGGNKLGYSTEVNTADLRADHSIEARVVTYDAAGNPGTDSATRTINVDTTAPKATITIGVIAGDDVINISENAQTKTTVNGTVGGDAKLGDTVTLTVNGHTYNTSVVNIGGNKLGYSTKVDTADLQADNSIDAKVVTYDAAGNPGSATATRDVSFDTTAPTAAITIGVIAGDDVINIAESHQPKTTVGGTVGGDVKVGDTVTLTVNNHTYNATVVNSGGTLTYSTQVNTSDLRADHSIDAKVVTYDAAGNPGSATASRTVNVDTTPPTAAITIGVIAGDDVINIEESHQLKTTVSGTVGGDVKAGDTVVLSVNHHTYTALVVNTGGTLTYSTQVNTFDLRADTSIDAIVTTYDAAGNPATASANRTIKLDSTAPTPAITIGVIAGDDVINIAESNQPTTTVGGTVGGDAKAGDTVTLTVNNHTYTATVVNAGGTLRYSTDVNTSDLQADPSIDAKVVTYDAAGNPGSATATRAVTFDTTAPTAAITIGAIAGDDVLNITEDAQATTTVGGTVGGDAKVGDTVTLTVN
ncbi:MAG: Ig-like domain-containing protein, partial [Deltaproteobacteria bacterium]|nr:Ig-like domain-containing protein [Deltaproteobacteria bacterium]